MKLIRISTVYCMSCIFMNEVLKKIEKKYSVLYEIQDLDYDNDQEEVKKYNLKPVLPVYILLDENSKEIDRLVGEKSKKELEQFLLTNGAINEKENINY